MKDPAKKFNWWWRDLDKAKAKSKVLRAALDEPMHRVETLRAAWYYEAEKRTTGKYRVANKSFLRLTFLEMRSVVYLWSFNARERTAMMPMMMPVHEGDKPADMANWYWPRVSLNLEVSNKALFKALGPHLDEVRKRRNLSPSQRGPKRSVNPHSDVAWKQIEAWDRASAGEVLNDSDRKQKSEVEKKILQRQVHHQMGW